MSGPKQHDQPAAKSHDKHHDKHVKSVRFAVPEGDDHGDVAAPTPAPSKTAGLSSVPMFSFGTSGTSEVVKLVSSITSSVTAAPAVAVPQFSFGAGKRSAVIPPMPSSPAPAIAAELLSQVSFLAAAEDPAGLQFL